MNSTFFDIPWPVDVNRCSNPLLNACCLVLYIILTQNKKKIRPMFSLMYSKSILWTRHRSQHNIYKPYLSLESSFAGNMIGPIVIFLCHVMLLHSQGQLQIHSFRAYNESCEIHNQTKKLGKNVCKMRQMHCYFNE